MRVGLQEAANGLEAHEEPVAKVGGEGWVIRLWENSWLASYPNRRALSMWETTGCRPRTMPGFYPGPYFFSDTWNCGGRLYEMHTSLRARRESLHCKK